MRGSILVTGASGILGKAIVKAGVKGGFAVKQAVRDLKRAGAGVEAVRFDYADSSTFAPALKGVSGLLLIAPPLDPTAPAQLRPVIESAKAAGLGHIVFISAFGANHSEQAPLRVIEHAVMDSGVPFTILRPNFFMENFSQGFLAGAIRAQGVIPLPAGDGKTSFIAVEDIAAVAVAAFARSLAGQEFDLTGMEALDHTAVARIISEASGRAVTYRSITEEQMTAGGRAQGMPEPAIEYLQGLYGIVRAGFAAGVTGDVEKVTGRKPVRFEDFARAAAAAWR